MNLRTAEIERTARLCHEANKVYCEGIGDNSQKIWNAAPEWQKQSAIAGVTFHLTELEAGRTPEPRSSHESWMREKLADGWKYGPVKDAVRKEHPCIVPYRSLPEVQRGKDYVFVAIVTAMYQSGQLGELRAIPVTNEESDLELPTVNRSVHYHSFGTPGGEYKPLPRAAIVTEVLPDDPEGQVGLCVLNPTGQFFNRHTPYSPDPKPGHWNWPPRK